MAVTGLIMIGYLLVHMYGNLKVFLGPEAFNHYAHWLKADIGYPLMPHGWFLWIFRVVMLAAIVAHIASAWVLTNRAHGARTTKYANDRRVQQSYSSRTMRWGGVIIAAALVFHLLQFTTQTVQTGFAAGADPYTMVIASFRQWWVVLVYVIFIAAVTLHVRHGVWSALTTLGANTSPSSRRFLDGLSWVIAIVLLVGFLIMPLAVLVGWVN